MKNLLHLGEDRYLTTLLLKHFPTYKTQFVRDAHAYTVAPDDWKMLLSQRHRWINSTVHNLGELETHRPQRPAASLTRTTIPIVNLPLPPVPHNSFSSITFSTSQDSESDSSSSTDSSVELTDTDRCHARLAPLYNFPPLPPQPPLLQREPEQKVDPSKEHQFGVMMAAQRIKANLCKEELKRSSFAHLNRTSSQERKPIPGWTDCTDGWLAEGYSFAKPRDHSLPVDETSDPKRAYKGFVASSQRQHREKGEDLMGRNGVYKVLFST